MWRISKLMLEWPGSMLHERRLSLAFAQTTGSKERVRTIRDRLRILVSSFK